MFYFFYYFPLGLDVPIRRTAYGTWAILLGCTLGFAVQSFFPEVVTSAFDHLIFVPERPTLTALFANAYLHGGWLHLISNMVSLIVFGPALEDRLGIRRYLILYHVCNALANLAQAAMTALWMPETAHFGILGASGAIAGLMGLFVVRLYFARLRVGYWAFLPLQAYNKAGAVKVPALCAVLLWLLIQLGIAVTQAQGSIAEVAAGSHLGGFMAGVGFALLYGLRSKAVSEEILQRGKSYLDRALWYPAQGEFIEYVRRQPEDEEGHVELARTYRFTRRSAESDHHYLQACRILARAKRWDRILELYLEAEKGNNSFCLTEAMQWNVAQLLARSYRLLPAEMAYRKFEILTQDLEKASLALYRAAEIARQLGEEYRAEEAREILLQRYPGSHEAQIVRDEKYNYGWAA